MKQRLSRIRQWMFSLLNVARLLAEMIVALALLWLVAVKLAELSATDSMLVIFSGLFWCGLYVGIFIVAAQDSARIAMSLLRRQ